MTLPASDTPKRFGPVKVDLCSGTAAPQRKRDGYITTDIRPYEGVDHVLTLGVDPLPFSNNSVMEIRAHDALEHMREGIFDVMDECWRVMHPQGVFNIAVPRFPAATAVMHLDHWQFFLGEADAIPFAKALAPLLLGQQQKLFCIHTWSFFMAPADGIDPHGYLKGFWHLISQEENQTHLNVKLSPNKPGGRYPYKKVVRRDTLG